MMTQAIINGSPLAKLEALLGADVFFVPCEWGTKKPDADLRRAAL